MKKIINRNYANLMKDIDWSNQLSMGELTLKNRVVMAALTRTRCNS
jgi:2,4-dienoyl-CoA reductase-like NADH-dependent reductase (Old Yellow Enzyme family)